MAKTTTVQARIDPMLKQDAEKVLAAIGLNSTTAINMFYSQIKLRQGLPFDARIPNAETREDMSEGRTGKKLKNRILRKRCLRIWMDEIPSNHNIEVRQRLRANQETR